MAMMAMDTGDLLRRPPAALIRTLPDGVPPPDVAATAGLRSKALTAVGMMLACAGIGYFASLFGAPGEGGRGRALAEERHDDGHGDDHGGGHSSSLHTDPYAVLLPWFAQLMGLVAYLILSRYAHWLPYTAVMFVIGLIFGIVAEVAPNQDHKLVFSIRQWMGVNGEVIILVFLPGLLYLDSFLVNAHAFYYALPQLLTFAFPMVLGGTTLTALVLKFVFPPNVVIPDFPDPSFDWCMMVGAILAATDPVAVAVLLNELGAPPRLKVHISGESLLNDGSAFVFYSIFKLRFFYLLGVDGIGEDVGWGRGFALFFRLAFGGAAIGLAFGLGECVLLFGLKRRLSSEENVVQVATTITVAYLAFFTSEIVAGCSGIVAVVVCGIVVKTFGETLHNNHHLTHDFWHITEHLLNTLLFFLAGVVYGNIFRHEERMTAGDWAAFFGWLFIIYLFAIVIRFFLVFTFYPLTSRIGIGQSWREAFFMSYGGLRGAVGIALALSIYEEVIEVTGQEGYPEEKKREFDDQASLVFMLAGGIAFLTLVLNGPTAGPLLKKLGLVTPTHARDMVVLNYEKHMKQNTLVEYLRILSDRRFGDSVDYAVIRRNVPPLRDVTQKQLCGALATLKKKHPDCRPNLKNFLPYLVDKKETDEACPSTERPKLPQEKSRRNLRKTIYNLSAKPEEDFKNELRRIFISLLRSQIHRQIEKGALESRGFVPQSILHGLEKADDAAQETAAPMETWRLAQNWVHYGKASELALQKVRRTKGPRHLVRARFTVLQAIAHVHAHEAAAKIFKEEFSQVGEASLTATEKAILDESKDDIHEAEMAIAELDPDEVHIIAYQWVCKLLLSKSAKYFEVLLRAGLMTETEASGFLEKLEHDMFLLHGCEELESEGMIDARRKLAKLSSDMTSSELQAKAQECVSELRPEAQSGYGRRVSLLSQPLDMNVEESLSTIQE